MKFHWNGLRFTIWKAHTRGQRPTQTISQWPPNGTCAAGRRNGILCSSSSQWEKGSFLHLGTWSKCSISNNSLTCDWGALATGCLCALILILGMFCKDFDNENVFLFVKKNYQCTRGSVSVDTGPSLPTGRDVFLQLRDWHWGLLPRASQFLTFSRWRQKNPQLVTPLKRLQLR